MLTQREDVEVHALKERGWSITAIANHLDRISEYRLSLSAKPELNK